ncbi:MAG: flagellar protein FlgN [Roseburia sp.]|uniref:flagellar protein FlgN n=1 Tax=Roseburia sp. 831b TaxID=1261635 RepID=UPI000ABC8ED1|nr:flagellar protein FlgN [Roseburia sp. 831b]MDD6217631.1 flagellar protein FlgN [Roseburia sp.]WVK72802.1 flagellar protein FlgN [Roseburia sp. 831b]
MASLMEDLLDVLEKEEQQYKELSELGETKKEVIVAAKIPELQEITAKEQDAASVLANLAKKRNQVLTDMATVLGKDPKEMTVQKMVGYLENQPKEQERLADMRERLLEAGTKMALINKQNEELLKQAMEMVEFDLTLLKSMRQAPETANYNKNAYTTGELLGGGSFDAKQ